MSKIKYFVLLLVFTLSIANCATPLVTSAIDGDIKKATELLDKGTDINETAGAMTPLMYAAREGKTDMVKLLLDRGANVNYQSCGGFGEHSHCYSALSHAVLGDHPGIIQMLFKKGAVAYTYDIQLAEEKGNPQIIQMLKSSQSKTISMVKSSDMLLIAVMDFDGKGVSKQDALRVSEWLRTELINTNQFKVIERSAMNAILKEQAFAQTGCTDTSCAVQVGKLLSAKKMLVGTVESWKNKVFINGRIIDVEKGIAEFAHKETVNSMLDLDTGAANFAKNLAKRINGM